jgi:AmmeMemoRadiSam system protein B
VRPTLKRTAAVSSLLVFVAAMAALALPLGDGNSQPTGPLEAEQAFPVAFFDEHEFADALLRAEETPAEPMPGARALIIPHHWTAGGLILRGIRDLAATGNISRIVLVGPDHVNAGRWPATTSDLAWQTPFGRLEADAGAVERLTGSGLARSDPDVLAHEHSVAGIVHAIAYYMPQARIVPLALRHDMTFDEITALASAVAREADGRTAVIASVDFSHYLSAPEAEAKDSETLAVLQVLDSPRIMGFGNEHLDSPPSIVLTMEVARLLGARNFVLRENTNSGLLSGTLPPPVTSYIEGYFAAR